MKKYEKPAISVMNLQLKENIAAVSTTVIKGASKKWGKGTLVKLALKEEATGLDQELLQS